MASIQVEVVYARRERQELVSLSLAAGATVTDALRSVADRPPFDQLDLARAPVGIFGDRVGGDRVLQHGDRVEVYRPLQIDPREARRLRAQAGPEGR